MRKESFLSTSRAIWVKGQDFRCSTVSIIKMVLHKNWFLRWILKIQVAYEVRSTSLGKGVFVLEEVKQGSLIWRYVHKRKNQQPWSDLIEQKWSFRYKKGENVICFNGEEETLAHMEMLTSYEERQPKRKKRYSCLFLRRYFVEHSYHDNGVLNHILDDGKLVNHSHTPNAGAGVHDNDLGLLQQPNLHAQPWSLHRLRTSFYLCSQRY